MNFGSLFSGIGGIDLGLERAGMRCAWQVENDEYCQRVLAKHWPGVPRFGDIRELVLRNLEPVDLIGGGFPCQDVSSAHTSGQRLALEGEQSGLWREFWRVLEALRPRWAVIENVSAWRSWVPDVRADLAGAGYASLPMELPAGAFGAPHRRSRIFLVADSDSDGESLLAFHEKVAGFSPVPRLGGYWGASPSRGFRVGDGVPGEMDRLRALGNAVVPQVAEWVGRRIIEYERRERE